MYFPYLRGKQFELIALRELLMNSILSSKIIPIIEPVKLSSTFLNTLEEFKKANKSISIIRNPKVGKFISELKDEKNSSLKERYRGLIGVKDIIISAYIVNENTKHSIDKIQQRGWKISDLLILCYNSDCIPVYEDVFSTEKPKYSVIPDESNFRRRIRSNRIMIEDKFNKLARNTDYADNEDEPYSSDHLYYIDDGYIGFSDYSIVGDDYNEIGFAPYAVAIHIVYFDKDKNLRIKHFVSDTNDDISDPAGKFSEAVEKLVRWNRIMKLNTLGIREFTRLYENSLYPGLGTIKKLSVMHHFELLGNYLDGLI